MDLDCVNHQEGKIRLHTWVSEQEMQLQNETIQKMNAENYLNLLIYNTTGIVFTYLAGMKDANKIQLQNFRDHQEILVTVVEQLNTQFLGGINLLGKEQTNEDEEQTAKVRHILNNIEICNMRYLDEFICQYEKNYYELPHDDYVKYMEVFVQKLPSPFNITLPKLFKENIDKKIVSDSFGGMIRTLREYVRTLCIQSQEIKRVKRTFEFNCENYKDIPQKFGCERQRKY